MPGVREGKSCFPCVYSSNVPGEVMITLILRVGKPLSRRAGVCVVLRGQIQKQTPSCLSQRSCSFWSVTLLWREAERCACHPAAPSRPALHTAKVSGGLLLTVLTTFNC